MLASGKISLVFLLFAVDSLAVRLAYTARFKGLNGQTTSNGYNAGTVLDDEAAFIRANCGTWGYNCSPAGRDPLNVKVPTIAEDKDASKAPLDAMRSRVNAELRTYRQQRDAAAAANNGGGVNSAPRRNNKLGKGNKLGKNNKPGPSGKKPRSESKRKRNIYRY